MKKSNNSRSSKSDNSKNKRVLLVNPKKEDAFIVTRLHQGLTLLAKILVMNGHEVKLMDYSFLKSIEAQIDVPTIEEVINKFQPHVIGISVFTYVYDECCHLIDTISRCSNANIVLGGPHFTIFPEDFCDDSRISYIVIGEAEKVILNVLEVKKSHKYPIIINAPVPKPEDIPVANIDVAYGNKHLQVYQIQLSRGCPYHCSFCNVQFIAGRKIRARNLENCINEIVEAKKRYPGIRIVNISDDCPSFNMKRFKKFLSMYLDADTGCELSIDNLRANLVDEEMLQLYKKAGGTNICLGVESAHPEVFGRINKGESFEEIVHAATLIRKYGLSLGFCFVIGLPGDTLEHHKASMQFAKSFKPDICFWNMCVPWPGTEIHAWYQEHGQINDIRNFSSFIDPHIKFHVPIAFSSDFSQREMIKAWFMANLETHRHFRNPQNIWKLLIVVCKYNLYKSFLAYLGMVFLPEAKVRLKYYKHKLRQILSVLFK